MDWNARYRRRVLDARASGRETLSERPVRMIALAKGFARLSKPNRNSARFVMRLAL